MTFEIKKLLIATIILALIFALGFYFQDKMPFLQHLGHLPGDFSFKYQGLKIYFPLTTCLLFSGIISLIFIIVQKIFK